MSRPKISEQDKRVVQVNIRLTETESSKVSNCAFASALTPANWIRYKIFTGKNPPVRMSSLDTSIYQELKRIGVNLNQIAHKLNQGDFPKELATTQLELLLLLNKAIKIMLHDGQHDQG